MECGDSFMLDDDDETKEHLHVILSKPTAEGEVVTAAICSRHRWSETLVCLDVGDHPFIRISTRKDTKMHIHPGSNYTRICAFQGKGVASTSETNAGSADRFGFRC
jgi:hypothetical protein